MAFEHRLRVRYGETDQMGVVHHANYLLYLEEARTAWMRELGCPYRELEESGVGLPVRRCELRYHASARYEDELCVSVWLDGLRGASVRFGYRVVRAPDGELLATATIELACVDMTASPPRPRMLPDDLRARFESIAAE